MDLTAFEAGSNPAGISKREWLQFSIIVAFANIIALWRLSFLFISIDAKMYDVEIDFWKVKSCFGLFSWFSSSYKMSNLYFHLKDAKMSIQVMWHKHLKVTHRSPRSHLQTALP